MGKDNFQAAVSAYNTGLDKILESGDNWYSFLLTMGNNSRLPRAAQVAIWNTSPNAYWTMNEKQWARAGYACEKERALTVPSGNSTVELFTSESVYPLDDSRPVPVWYFEDDLTTEIAETLAKQFNLNIEDKNNVLSVIKAYVSVYENVDDKINLFGMSLRDILLSRLGKNTMPSYGYSYDVSSLNRSSAQILIDRLNLVARPFFDVVRTIAEKNQKSVSYTFDRGKTERYNLIEISEQEVPSNGEYLGQNNDGHRIRLHSSDVTSESRGQLRADSGDGILGDQTLAVGGAGERLRDKVLQSAVGAPDAERSRTADRIDAEGAGARTSVDGRLLQTVRENVRPLRPGTSNSSTRGNTGVTSHRLLEICARKYQRHQEGRGNSNAGSNLQLNLFETQYNDNETVRLDENDPAVFYYENFERQILSGSGVESGKFRIYKYFTEHIDKKERVTFLKSEYGIGGSTFTFSDGEIGWSAHDGKGLELRRDSDNVSLQLSYYDVAYIIDELIQADVFLSEKEKAAYEPYWEEWRAREQRRDLVNRVFELSRSDSFNKEELPQSVFNLFSKFRETQNRLITDGFDAVQYHDTLSVGQHLYNYLVECEKIPQLQDGAKELLQELRALEPGLFERDNVADYFKLKEAYPDSLLLFPVGDFYEAMGDDAVSLAEELDLIQTSRDTKTGERVPMTGFPVHKLEDYTNALVRKGFTVAIATVTAEQIPDKTYTIVPAQDKPVVVSDDVETKTAEEILDTPLPETQKKELLDLRAFEEKLPRSEQIGTYTHRNFRTLARFVPALLNNKVTYLRLEAGEGMEPLVIERIGGGRISMAHYYEQMGDLMADPDMEFIFEQAKQELRPRTFQQDNMGVYQTVEREDGSVNFLKENELSRFTETWLKNLHDQEYLVSQLIFDYNGTDLRVTFDSDGNAYQITPEDEGRQFCEEFNYVLADFKEPQVDRLSNVNTEAEIETVYNLLRACNIDDMTVRLEGETIIASDEDGNTWSGAELYRFLLDEVLAFNEKGKLVDGLYVSENILTAVKEYAKHYDVEPTLVPQRPVEQDVNRAATPGTNNTLENESPTDRAKRLITEYSKREFHHEPDFSDMSKVNLAYTETEDGKHTIEVNADLLNFSLETLIDGLPFKAHKEDSLENLIQNQLESLAFDDLVFLNEQELSQFETARKAQEPIVRDRELVETSNNYQIADDSIGVGTPRERYKANVEAVKTLKLVESEGRNATPDEQAIMAKYVGWGGLSSVFDEKSEHYNELRSLLNEQEYAAARSSTLTAFYTPPIVIRSIYAALQNMGFDGGEVLEPSCGVGNFFGLLPEDLKKNVNLTGVELDSISGRIAKQLYPNADIHVKGFEETDFRDGQFDVAIGNVPFGQFSVNDRPYNKFRFLIHDYFFAKALDKVRAGGVVAFITSKGTLDKETPTVRKYLAKRAELLGAIRLPNNAFKRAAGTEVTTDIIFLKKREIPLDIEPDWVYLNTDANGLEMNDYFVQHPDMILGKMQRVSTAYGYDTACIDNGTDLSTQLAVAIQNIAGVIDTTPRHLTQQALDDEIPVVVGVRDNAYTIVNDKVYQRIGSVMEYKEKAQKKIDRVRGLIAIREQVYSLIEIQLEGATDEIVALHQERLSAVYTDFVNKFGRISDRANKVFEGDPAHSLLCSLEHFDANKEFVGLSDMFTKRTVRPNRVITSAQNANDALMASLNVHGKVDIEYMQTLTGFSKEKLVSDLTNIIYRVPIMDSAASEEYVTADEYLSGNVREKLEFARVYRDVKKEAWIDVNIAALEGIQPEPLRATQIQVRLGSTWVPTDIVDAFMHNLLKTNSRGYIKSEYSDLTGVWGIANKNWESWSVAATSTYGTKRVNAYDLLEDALNLRDTVVRDRVTEDGKDKYVINEQETRLAQGKQKLIRQAFNDWVWRDPERRKRLEGIYNQKFNSTVQRKYDGSHLQFDGMNCNITLRPHQKDAIARCLYGKNALLAHCVGAGKTFEMCAAAMEGKRVGLWHKSLIVVPNNIVAQFGAEFMELYPSANILVATEKDFSKENRRRFCSRIATNNYDAVIIGHSQFERIPLSLATEERMLQAQIDEIEAGIKGSKDADQRFTVKQLQASLKSAETRLKKLQDIEQDDVVTFEELGVDKLFVDEAHNYKNLFLYTKMSNVAGISTTEAKKSTDMFNKVRWLDEQTGGRGTVFATGTPVSNSMTELYTMQRYLMHDELKASGLLHFDAWASTFGETTTELELKPEGTGFRLKKRFAKFFNVPELMASFRRVADIITKDMIQLPTPEIETVNRVVEASDVQKRAVKSFAERADRVRDGGVTPDVDNMLKITSDGRKLALDQRLMDDALPDYPDSKVNDCVDNVFQIWTDTADQRSTQLVFCDLSTPNGKGFNVYDDIKAKLIAKGVPEAEIAFAHDANTNAQKEALSRKVRSGSVRILIGSTQKCGTGTNVQDRLIAIHNLDVPWRPADIEQRQGRIERQGNMNDKAYCYFYVTEGTFDAYMYQIVEKKQRFISQIMQGDTTIRELEDLDESSLNYAKLKALATGNPLIQEKMELDLQVRDLMLQKSNHQSQIFELQDRIAVDFPKNIRLLRTKIESLKDEIQTVAEHSDEEYIVYDGNIISEPKSIGTLVNTFFEGLIRGDIDEVPFGTYKGMPMTVNLDSFTKRMLVNIGAHTHIEMRIDATTNGKKILGSLDTLNEKLSDAEQQLEETLNDFEEAKVAVNRDFPLQMELDKKQARLEELNAIFEQDKSNQDRSQQRNDYIQ